MNRILPFALVLSWLSFLPLPSNALVFTDEAAFQTAAGGVAVETFEGYSPFVPVSALSGLHLSFSQLNNGSFPETYDQRSGGVTRSGTITLMNNDRLGLPGLGPMEVIADPGTQFLAFGYWNTGTDDTTRLTLFDENDVVIESAVSGVQDPAFLGIINATGAVRAVIEAVGGNGWFSIDDLQVDTGSVPVAVSAPGGASLLLLAALLLCRRR